MFYFIKKFIPLFFILTLTACTNPNKKVVVEGASSEVTSSIDSDELKNNGSDEDIVIQDTLSESEKINKVLTEKLMEVGDRVFFGYDQASFKKEGIETLKRQARFLIENQKLTITVEGHCDSRGTREYNLALGERRAYAVKSFLTSLGVADDRISVISFGKEKLQSIENNVDGWAQSRTAITVINP
tara:strand:- start:2870 stop:3427 length:558 start_codon:yes stop_codon:yes gene_type:complete